MKFKLLLGLLLPLAAAAQTVDFKLHSGFLIVVKCSIANMQDLAAVIDTGLTETAIDVKLAKRLGLPTRPDRATFGTRESQTLAVLIPNLVVGPLRPPMLAGIAIDMSGFEHRVGVHADVMVGMDVLGHRSFFIDYKSKKITFAEPPPFKYRSLLTAASHLLLVPVEIGKTKLTLQLDTAFNGILIYGNRVATPFGEPGWRSETILGEGTAQMTFQSMRIGTWEARQLAMAITDEAPRGDTLPFDGLLGPIAIGARRIAFDSHNGLFLWE